MKRHSRLCGALLSLAMAAPLTAAAQERGRTDGPEESEYGKGGYSGSSSTGVSFQLEWGAAVNAEEPPRNAPEGPPLYVGATVSWWGADWFALDANVTYVFDGGRTNVMVGPRFRSWGWPLVFSLGLKAGAIYTPDYVDTTYQDVRGNKEELHFGISPQVGAEVLMGSRDRVSLGLFYTPDIPIGGGGVTHRLGMAVGYRF
ncbi:hypothetical protein LXT21_04690 [Myxococcus sp. K38C18041901]|uniref:hypothetical protein n=1 Tax=Myxococcus guangdongensis TaxID=2906760 RepID=UPI0020A741FB|nr:hypothetical protein [Myxococcus guangdongensis]MCP3058072.1 hypothetical protein [Myxococcus guangdongensis]